MDIVSTKMTNTIAKNVTKNCHSKKERYKSDCYILQTILGKIIGQKQEDINALTM